MTKHPDSAVDDLAGTARGRLNKPLNRRLFLAGATAGVTALGLTACGGPGATPEASPTTGAAGFPVTLAGKEGTATIPAEPQRVVALGFQRDADTALALGIRPVAITENTIFPNRIAPWVEAELADPRPELLKTTDGIPFEKVAGLRPDLILATDNYELTDNYDRLAQIAPTLSYIENVDSDTWQQRTIHIGKALGRREQAQQLIADIEAKVIKAAQDHPAFAGKTFSRSYVFNGQIRAIVGDDAAVTFLEQLGMKLSPEVSALPEGDTEGRAIVSPENLHVLDADVMMISYTSEDDQKFLESNELFQQLNTVKNGTYVRLDQASSSSLAFPSVLSIPYGLEQTVTALANALA